MALSLPFPSLMLKLPNVYLRYTLTCEVWVGLGVRSDTKKTNQLLNETPYVDFESIISFTLFNIHFTLISFLISSLLSCAIV